MSPTIDLNLDLAVKNLTSQIIEIQKERLKDKGEDALNNAVNDIISGNNPLGGIKDIIKGNGNSQDSTATTPKDPTKPVDSTATSSDSQDKVKEVAGNLINDLFGRNRKKKDTTKTK